MPLRPLPGFFSPSKVRNEFYKDTQGVILVYDACQKESFDSLDAWLSEMKQELGPQGSIENIVFAVCANKVRAERALILGRLGEEYYYIDSAPLWSLCLLSQIDCTKLRCVDESEGRLWAESRGFLYFETSAQSGEGINEMFQVSHKNS